MKSPISVREDPNAPAATSQPRRTAHGVRALSWLEVGRHNRDPNTVDMLTGKTDAEAGGGEQGRRIMTAKSFNPRP